MKYILTILFFFSTLSFGFAQGVNPLNRGCYPSPSTYFGFNTGLNLSKLNQRYFPTNYFLSGQFSFEIESLINQPGSPISSLLYGLSYDSKNYEVKSETIQTRNIQVNYITLPIKYQHQFFRFFKKLLVLGTIGGYYSILLNSSQDSNNQLLPTSNYGISLGLNSIYVFRNGVNLILEYSYQNGFAPIDNTTSFSSNISHVINIGFKVPSTAIF
ncbi:MAG: hypothetical protein ACE364_09560 [Chlorobiota bacterium]